MGLMLEIQPSIGPALVVGGGTDFPTYLILHRNYPSGTVRTISDVRCYLISFLIVGEITSERP